MNPNHTPTYKNSALPNKDRVDDLVSRMTLQEKVSQMLFDAPAIERLDIPEHNWWNECLHGVGYAGLATSFPQAIGLAATWDPDLMHQVAVAISDEARAKHHEAARQGVSQIHTGLTFWSPNVNIFRDPRWGRGQETYGECPYLTARMGVAFVRGLQGDDPSYLKVAATPKHFAAHSGPDSDRDSFDARVSERDLRDTYLPAFEACVKEGEAISVMGAYNRLNGEPCCASPTLLQSILRQQWGFDGYVVSDCRAIGNIYLHHKVVDTHAEAAALAVSSGCDLNCGDTYPALLEAVDLGFISEDTIDRAVKRLLTARFRLGMFDPPEQVAHAQIPYEVNDSPAHRELALQAARESIVLLKNEDDFLPLSKEIGSIAVIGPNADDLLALLGNFRGTPSQVVTPVEGVRRKISPTTKLYTAPGCEPTDGIGSLTVIPSHCLRPADPDGYQTGLTAAYYHNLEFKGEPAFSRVDPLVDFVWKDNTPLTARMGDDFSVCWTGFLVPPVSGSYLLGVRGLTTCRLTLDDGLVAEHIELHEAFTSVKEVELEAGRFYRVRLEYTNLGLDPQVQLLWSVPNTDLMTSALEAAKNAEVVVLMLGLSSAIEDEVTPAKAEGFAGGDRTDIKLPRPQEELLKRVHGLGKPVVLVLLNGSALAVNWAARQIPAIVVAWYPGQAGGNAIADVLFGDHNPCGRLPVTFYRSVDDLPPFEDYQMKGRTYRYFRGKPLFPFGYGLSYTTFEFDNLHIGQHQVQVGGQVAISCDVSNTGERTGDEVVQLYVRCADGTVSRPIKELKGFKRISLEPGECKTVRFLLHSHQLGYYREAMPYAVEPGTVEVMVGSSSEDLPLAGAFEIIGQTTDASDHKVFFSEIEIE